MELITCDISELPSHYPKTVITDFINEENFENFNVCFTSASRKGDNYMGDMYRINVTGNKGEKSGESIHLVLKLSPSSKLLRSYFPVHRFYEKEVFAYTVMLPYFEKMQDDFNIPICDRVKYPKSYRASSQESKEFIVMKDLANEGFKMFDRFKSLDMNHLRLAIQSLARFHALSFALKQRDPELFAEMASIASNSLEYGERFKPVIRKSMKESASVIDDEICKQKVDKYTMDGYEKIEQFLGPHFSAPYNVICHGDCWTNNFLFKYEGTTPVDIRIVDFQIIRHTSPVTDLVSLIFLSTDEDTRAKIFPDIFDLYYEVLASRLQSMDIDVEACYPKDIFRDHVKKILPFGLVYSLFAVPIQQSQVGNAPDIVEMLDKGTPVLKETFSQDCVERIQGIARDFVRYEMI